MHTTIINTGSRYSDQGYFFYNRPLSYSSKPILAVELDFRTFIAC